MTSIGFRIFCVTIAVLFFFFESAFSKVLIDYPSYPLNVPDVSFSYDDADRLVSMVQGSNTTSWEYNAAYELVALSMPQGGLEYEYDNLGRLWKLIKNETAVTEYEYDDASRLVSILNPYNELTEFEYDDDSRLTKKIFANSTYTALSWDDKSRLLSMLHKNSSHSLLKGEAYEYDAANRITARLRLPENETTTFGYDLIGQLTSETRSGYEAEYTYDANGNRLTRTINNETEEYAYDDGDKLLSITKGQDTIEFFYDACGRLIAVEEPNEVVTELFWDYEDRLIGIEFPDTSVNSFAYNPFGARVSKTDSTGTRTYFRAGVSSRSAVLSDGAATYTPGISERRNNISRFYTLNAQGSTTQLTDSSQDEAASFSYDAWGNRIGTRNSDDPPFLFGGGFGYETDPDTGLIWVGSKPFFPKIGRFISRSGGGSAVYGGGYAPVGNNPVVSPGGGISLPSGGGPSGPQIAPLEMVWVDPGVLGIGIPYKPWYQHGLDFGWDGLIGVGDMASWGLTAYIRQLMGTDEYVDYDSWGYKIMPLVYALFSGLAGVKEGGKLFVGGGSRNRNPWKGPVSEPVYVADSKGNCIPVKTGEYVTGSRDGSWVQVRDSKGGFTGVRLDGGHPPGPKHKDPRTWGPHAHRPGYRNPDGTPWLPVYY